MDSTEEIELQAERMARGLSRFLGIPLDVVMNSLPVEHWKEAYRRFKLTPVLHYMLSIQKSREAIIKHLNRLRKSLEKGDTKKVEKYKGWIRRHLLKIKYLKFLIELEKWKAMDFDSQLLEVLNDEQIGNSYF